MGLLQPHGRHRRGDGQADLTHDAGLRANNDAFRTLDDPDVKGKRVLVRADLNVPMEDGKVTDATRIERQAPTIRELADKGAKVIVLRHFDRPKGKVRAVHVAEAGRPPRSATHIGGRSPSPTIASGEAAEAAVAALKDGDVLLLENTRFHAGEEENDPAFAEAAGGAGRHLRQ